MASRSANFLTGSLNCLSLTANTLSLCTPLFSLALLKTLPITPLKKACTSGSTKIAETWIGINSKMLDMTHQTKYNITGDLDKINLDGWYMVISNHQSWADIFILQKIFNRRAPFFKFFLKDELIYVPIMGLCWSALDFPFMKRYSKEFLAKHPELKGKDLETTRKACEKFKHTPVSVMNFLEGTRFTDSKHQKQQSPYQYLLKPKAAGIAYALNIMGEEIDTMIDVTINYPEGRPNFWEFMCGKSQYIDVHIEKRAIPKEFRVGDYENDEVFRKSFQNWINQLWQHKDQLLAQMNKAYIAQDNILSFKKAS